MLTQVLTASGLEALTFPLTSGLGSVPSTAQLLITGFRKILCKVTSGLNTQTLWNSPDMRSCQSRAPVAEGREGGHCLITCTSAGCKWLPLYTISSLNFSACINNFSFFLTLSSLILLLLLPSHPLFLAFPVAATLCLLWTYTVKFSPKCHMYIWDVPMQSTSQTL